MHKDPNPQHSFYSDTPITTQEEDLFRNTSFLAEQLARDICNYSDNKSIVIALTGSWGVGKTSVINLCIDFINKGKCANKPRPIILRFNPWYYSGTDQLMHLFCTELYETIRREGNRALADSLRSWYKKVTRGWSSARVLFRLGIPFSGFDISFEKTQNETLELLKKNLDDELKRLNRKILVVIDDIDRLESRKIREVLQLTRMLSDLSNIIFLLAFDKSVLLKTLGEDVVMSEKYIEKIIQIPIEVSPPLPQMLKKWLRSLLSDLSPDFSPEEGSQQETRWRTVRRILERLFVTPRDVVRFMNLMRFRFLPVQKDVDAIDFFAATVLEMFAPEFYLTLREYKYFLLNHLNLIEEVGFPEEKERKQLIAQIKEKAPPPLQSEIDKLLCYLFPTLHHLLTHTTRVGVDTCQKYSKRICDEAAFDIYFRYVIPPEFVSASEMRALIEIAETDQQALIQEMKRLIQGGRAPSLVEQLDFRPDQLSPASVPAFISALLENEQEIIRALQETWGEHLHIYCAEMLSKTLLSLFRQVRRQDERDRIALSTLIPTAAKLDRVSLPLLLLYQEALKEEHDPSQNLFSPKILGQLAGHLHNSIAIHAKGNDLINQPSFFAILWIWVSHFGGEQEAIQYIQRVIDSDKGLVDFLVKLYKMYAFSTRGLPEFIKKLLNSPEISKRIRNIFDDTAAYRRLLEDEDVALDELLAFLQQQSITSS